jgi:hypothetical protein
MVRVSVTTTCPVCQSTIGKDGQGCRLFRQPKIDERKQLVKHKLGYWYRGNPRNKVGGLTVFSSQIGR